MVISRAEFNAVFGPTYLGGCQPLDGPSARFVVGEDDRCVTIVSGPAEKRYCDLALAYGLTVADGRELRVVLPEQQAGATLHRLAWLEPPAPVRVETYARVGAEAERRRAPSRQEAIRAYGSILKGKQTDAEGFNLELRAASVPLHLRERAEWVKPLVERLGERDDLDPAHNKGERSWHCRGQKILRLTRTNSPKPGIRIQAGIMNASLMLEITVHGPISAEQVRQVLERVDDGVHRRLREGEAYNRPDEHWLQAVLGRNAHLVGLESRTLREVPAWRRSGTLRLDHRPTAWGRGYIDLLGVDHHGTVQIVETKLAANDDPMFIFQGLDYAMYAEAYRRPITRRLDVHEKAPFAITYAVGALTEPELKLSRFAPAQLAAMDHLDHQFVTLTEWWHPPKRAKEAAVRILAGDQITKLVKAKGGSSSATVTTASAWSRAEIDRAVSELEADDEREVALLLLDHADRRDGVLKGGSGEAPSAGIYYDVDGKRRSLWALYVRRNGFIVRVNLDVLAKVRPDRIAAVTDALRNSPAMASRLASLRPKRFDVNVREALVVDPNVVSALLAALDRAIAVD